jgi:hypothetical protein
MTMSTTSISTSEKPFLRGWEWTEGWDTMPRMRQKRDGFTTKRTACSSCSVQVQCDKKAR